MDLERAVPENDIEDHRETHLSQSDDRDARGCSCGERAGQQKLSNRRGDSHANAITCQS